MFRISRIQQLLQAIPRGMFNRLVHEHQGDKHSKGFGCWDQLVAMVYAQLSGASSLRQLEVGFNAQHNHHYHLSTRTVRRTTLAEANAKRPVAVFEGLALALMAQGTRKLRRECQELLYLLDASCLTLKGRGFDQWTASHHNGRTQGMKLHLRYALPEGVPAHAALSAANVNDVEYGRTITPEAGATYVFDKGYCDYTWWHQLDVAGAYFLTRLKRNARVRLLHQRPVPSAQQAQIAEDALIELSNRHPRGGRINPYDKPLRRITVHATAREAPLVLITNDLQRPAQELAQRYRERWQIELFFKWIKQHLRVKGFLGRSENAVRIQVLCALIAYLLLALYRQTQGYRGSLWQLLGELRATLFQRPTIEHACHRKRRERARFIQQVQPGLFT